MKSIHLGESLVSGLRYFFFSSCHHNNVTDKESFQRCLSHISDSDRYVSNQDYLPI